MNTMKSAIVLGARQRYGFMICEQLLEQDYQVYAKDFIQWQTSEQEERWLFIGRNAHLQYAHLHEEKNIFDEKVLMIIVPLVDFYSQQKTEVHDLLLSILKEQNSMQIQTPIVLIQPSCMQRSYSTFSQAIEKIKEERIKMGGEVLEYHITMGNEDIYFRLNNYSEWIKNTEGGEIGSVIHHLSEKVKADGC